MLGLGDDLDDDAAQLAGAPQRVEQVQVVVGQQRRGEPAGQAAQEPGVGRRRRVGVGGGLLLGLADGGGQASAAGVASVRRSAAAARRARAEQGRGAGLVPDVSCGIGALQCV